MKKQKKLIVLFVLIIVIILGFFSLKIHLYTKVYCTIKECKPAVISDIKNITFPEGYTIKQIFNKITSETSITDNELNNNLKNTKLIGLPKVANNMLEGWLFPDTYSIDRFTSATDLLSRMVLNTIQHLQNLKIKEKDWNKTIILASMIEKEAKINKDRPKVARVFLNRIAKGNLLQSDATVSYGSENTGSVWTTDKERNKNNGYNTYKRKGLPIGAICNPGLSSIDASIHPAKGNWMYFVVIDLDTGETEFNETSAEHAKSVEKLKTWIKKHKK